MDCRQVQPKIADYSVGLLRGRESEQVAEHLAACALCAREWRELQAVLGLVERFGAREPPPHLWNGVYNRITADTAREAAPWWERLLGAPRRVMAGAATGVAAAAVLAALYLYPLASSSRPEPPPTNAPTAVAMQQHAMLAGAEPLADEVGLEAYAQLINNPNVNSHLIR